MRVRSPVTQIRPSVSSPCTSTPSTHISPAKHVRLSQTKLISGLQQSVSLTFQEAFRMLRWSCVIQGLSRKSSNDSSSSQTTMNILLLLKSKRPLRRYFPQSTLRLRTLRCLTALLCTSELGEDRARRHRRGPRCANVSSSCQLASLMMLASHSVSLKL